MSRSTAFELLSPAVQRWVYDAGWPGLRDAQEQAIPLLLARDRDVLISAATASGKTEAAFLPILSALDSQSGNADGLPGIAGPSASHRRAGGVQVLYVAPLKALINDLHQRVVDMTARTELTVERWHGDVPGSSKRRVLHKPPAVLLLTPESLEAMFVLRGTTIPTLFRDLQYVVVDELHAFLGTERGAQLLSLLHRLDLAAARRPVRVGLSATLGDMRLAAAQLRPDHPDRVALITSNDGGQELRLSVRGYQQQPPPAPERRVPHAAQPEAVDDPEQGNDRSRHPAGGLEDQDAIEAARGEQAPEANDTSLGDGVSASVQDAIAAHVHAVACGTDNLVFANSRGAVEFYADRLRRRSDTLQLPNEFLPHHGNLSRGLREEAEGALKDPERSATVIATTTLEMGIDIGSVSSVTQIGPPPSVASLRQRMGRSGRRGEPGVLRVHIVERTPDRRCSLDDELRAGLVQTVAMIDLLLEGWCEPPSPAALHTSTLVQQLLSLIAERGGVTPAHAWQALCGPQGPFAATDVARFAQLLRDLGEQQVLEQDATGLLLLGSVGERTVNHYSFYSAFVSPEEFRLLHHGQQLGVLPLNRPLRAGLLLVFGGRRWLITNVDTQRRAVDVVPGAGGAPPLFSGSGMPVHDVVRARMRRVLAARERPAYLDPVADALLQQGQDVYQRQSLDNNAVIADGQGTVVLPWAGTVTSDTLALQLQQVGVAAGVDGLAIACPESSPKQVKTALGKLAWDPAADAVQLAALLSAKAENKYDPWVSDLLLNQDYAARRLDTTAGQQVARRLLRAQAPGLPHSRRSSLLGARAGVQPLRTAKMDL